LKKKRNDLKTWQVPDTCKKIKSSKNVAGSRNFDKNEKTQKRGRFKTLGQKKQRTKNVAGSRNFDKKKSGGTREAK